MKAFTTKRRITPASIEQEIRVGILEANSLNNVGYQKKYLKNHTTESEACAGVT